MALISNYNFCRNLIDFLKKNRCRMTYEYLLQRKSLKFKSFNPTIVVARVLSKIFITN